MGNLKQVETESLSLLSRLANSDSFVYPVAIKVEETGGEERIEVLEAYTKGQMLSFIEDIAVLILESKHPISLMVKRIDQLPTDKHIHSCLN